MHSLESRALPGRGETLGYTRGLPRYREDVDGLSSHASSTSVTIAPLQP